jgi:hypothetical protein
MFRRKYISASAALLTVGVAGCSESAGDTTPTDDSTSTAPSTTTDAPTETPMATSGTQLQYEGDSLTLDNAPEQELRGTTDLESGTTLEISLDSETPSDPLIKRPPATVTDEGTFSATVDMSDADEGTEFTVSVVTDDDTVAEADGRVV